MMKFKVEAIIIVDEDGEKIGLIDHKPPNTFFVPQKVEYTIQEMDDILTKMQEVRNGSYS